jgi:hypothetical protein
MTFQDQVAQVVADTAISRTGRRIYENLAYGGFLLIAIGPVIAGFADHELAKRAQELQGPILSAETALGIFVGWMKSLGHRENMQAMKGPTS